MSVDDLRARIHDSVNNARKVKAAVQAAEKQHQEEEAQKLEAQREREADRVIPEAMKIMETLPEILAKAELDGKVLVHVYTAKGEHDPMLRALTRLCRQMSIACREVPEETWWNTFYVEVPGYEDD